MPTELLPGLHLPALDLNALVMPANVDFGAEMLASAVLPALPMVIALGVFARFVQWAFTRSG